MKSLVLLSGGLDSMTLAHRALEAGTLACSLFLDWGQPAARAEEQIVTKFISESGLRMPKKQRGKIVRVGDLQGVPSIGLREYGAHGPMVIPARNPFLLSYACNLAEVRGIDVVQFGANADDALEYPDCREEFVDGFNYMLARAGVNVRVESPFIRVTKRQIWQEAKRLKIGKVMSCYTPIREPQAPPKKDRWKPCGECNSCLALAQAKIS